MKRIWVAAAILVLGIGVAWVATALRPATPAGPSRTAGPEARERAAPSRPPARLRHGTESVNGVRLHYVIAGRGPPVVLFHGFPQTWYSWRKVIPVLAREHTVVAVDLRGTGRSSVPRSGYDKDTMAADVHALVRRLRLGGRVSLVGHDLGAWVAYAYARRYREEVRRLAFLEAALPGFGLEELLDFSRPDRGVWHLAFFRQPDVPERLLEGRERYFVDWFIAPRRAARGAFSARSMEVYTRAYARPGRMGAALEQYRALYRDAAANRAGSRPPIDVPVLALGGERASGRRPLESMRRVATRVSGGVLPDAGHWLMEERPAETSERLRRFLR